MEIHCTGSNRLENINTRSLVVLVRPVFPEQRDRFLQQAAFVPRIHVSIKSPISNGPARWKLAKLLVFLLFQDLVVLGLCLPSTCTVSELTAVLEKIFRDRTLLISQLYSADLKLRKVSNLRNDNQWLLSWNMILVMYVRSERNLWSLKTAEPLYPRARLVRCVRLTNASVDSERFEELQVLVKVIKYCGIRTREFFFLQNVYCQVV